MCVQGSPESPLDSGFLCNWQTIKNDGVSIIAITSRSHEMTFSTSRNHFSDISVQDYLNDFYCSRNRIPNLDLHLGKSLIYSAGKMGRDHANYARGKMYKNHARNKVDETEFC